MQMAEKEVASTRSSDTSDKREKEKRFP